MGSNTHSRNADCASTPVGSNGNSATLSNQAWESYHTYGAWWKSKNEVLFYLDGAYIYSITPPSDFDLPMYLRMVTETYDWNPVPADGGMTGNADSRTTYYDWVHTYRLIDVLDADDFSTLDDESIKLYPNPAKDIIIISGVENTEMITVVDLSGRIVAVRKQKTDTGISIHTSQLEAGVYVALIANGNTTSSYKFIKE